MGGGGLREGTVLNNAMLTPLDESPEQQLAVRLERERVSKGSSETRLPDQPAAALGATSIDSRFFA